MWEIGGDQASLGLHAANEPSSIFIACLVFFFGVAETLEGVVEMDDSELMAYEDRLRLQREHWISHAG
jgi:hypothetical protein